jgi:hypothetical protein
MFDKINVFDRRVAKAVFEAFPDWSSLATVEESNGEYAFVLSVAPPLNNVTYPLRIATFDGEVTVSFEYCHAHFNDFSKGTDYDALTFTKQIISGDYAAVSYWRDHLWFGSQFLDANSLPTSNEEFPHANRIHIRSWTGTLDKDIRCSPVLSPER